MGALDRIRREVGNAEDLMRSVVIPSQRASFLKSVDEEFGLASKDPEGASPRARAGRRLNMRDWPTRSATSGRRHDR